jgi:hypothetical protein
MCIQIETCKDSDLLFGSGPGADLRITLRTDPWNWLRTGRYDQVLIHERNRYNKAHGKGNDVAPSCEVFGSVAQSAGFVI